MKKLGFGMMRLPLTDPEDQKSIDLPQVEKMVDLFLERGFTYFDTAYPYHGGESENAVRKALVSRHSRERYTLASKLPMWLVAEDRPDKSQEDIFQEQLTKCGVDYFDYYLLHALGEKSFAVAESHGSFAFLSEKKREGKIRHLGFSFHDKAEVLDRILTQHPEAEFVQLQINYLDWDDERVQSRKCYETALRHGKQVVVMEPVKGGKLAKVPEEVAREMERLRPGASPASWAVRFAAGLPGVMTVLSGMSDLSQMEDNTGYMGEFRPLEGEEAALVAKAAEIIHAQPVIACTACRYCVEGCPQNIPIPDYFAHYNKDQENLIKTGTPDKAGYQAAARGHGLSGACVECRQCEDICPQHLPVTDWLKRLAKTYEE